MGSSIFQTALIALGTGVLSGFCAWLIQHKIGKQLVEQLAQSSQQAIGEVTAQRDQLARKYTKSRARIESLQTVMQQRNAEFEDIAKKSKVLAANVSTLCTERESTKVQLSNFQKAVTVFKQQTAALQSEFQKTQELYKRELQKSFEKRKLLDKEIKRMLLELKESRIKQEQFANSVESSSLEHGSEKEMVIAAQLRLGQIEVMERNLAKLDDENEQLNQNIAELRNAYNAQQGELAKTEELRIHNKQLIQAVEALEGARQEHESDAEKYRQQADDSTKVSETLRFRLADLQQGFADIEKEQGQVLQSARKAVVVPLMRNKG